MARALISICQNTNCTRLIVACKRTLTIAMAYYMSNDALNGDDGAYLPQNISILLADDVILWV
jgi:hypothetical protein